MRSTHHNAEHGWELLGEAWHPDRRHRRLNLSGQDSAAGRMRRFRAASHSQMKGTMLSFVASGASRSEFKVLVFCDADSGNSLSFVELEVRGSPLLLLLWRLNRKGSEFLSQWAGDVVYMR